MTKRFDSDRWDTGDATFAGIVDVHHATATEAQTEAKELLAAAEAVRVLAETEAQGGRHGRFERFNDPMSEGLHDAALDALAIAITDALPLFDELADGAHFDEYGYEGTCDAAVQPHECATGIRDRNRATDAAIGGAR